LCFSKAPPLFPLQTTPKKNKIPEKGETFKRGKVCWDPPCRFVYSYRHPPKTNNQKKKTQQKRSKNHPLGNKGGDQGPPFSKLFNQLKTLLHQKGVLVNFGTPRIFSHPPAVSVFFNKPKNFGELEKTKKKKNTPIWGEHLESLF